MYVFIGLTARPLNTYMNIQCVYADQKADHKRVLTNLAQGIKGQVYCLSRYKKLPRPDILVLAGFGYGMLSLYQQVLEHDQAYWYVDHAYIQRGYNIKNEWMRVTANNFVQSSLKSCISSARYQKYFSHIKLGRWQGFQGQYILHSPLTDGVALLFPQSIQWEKQMLERIKELGLPIKQRFKNPIQRLDRNGLVIKTTPVIQRSLEEDVAEAALVVSYSSSILVNAALAGKPVIGSENNVAYPISANLSCVQQEPNRIDWLYNLVNSQFNTEELRSGSFKQFLE